MARVTRHAEPGNEDERAVVVALPSIPSTQDAHSCINPPTADAFEWTEFVNTGSFGCCTFDELEQTPRVECIPCFHIHAVLNRASDLSLPREGQKASPFGTGDFSSALPLSGFLDPDLFDDDHPGDNTEKQLFDSAESTPLEKSAKTTVCASFPEKGNHRIRSLMEYCTHAMNTMPCSDEKKYPFQRALNRSGANERRLSSQSLLWNVAPENSSNSEGSTNPMSVGFANTGGNTKGLTPFVPAKVISPTESKSWVSTPP